MDIEDFVRRGQAAQNAVDALTERKKPEFVANAFDMSHVPPPNPENFWKLLLNEPRVILIDESGSKIEPLVTITVREIDGQRISLQITTSPKMKTYVK